MLNDAAVLQGARVVSVAEAGWTNYKAHLAGVRQLKVTGQHKPLFLRQPWFDLKQWFAKFDPAVD